MRKKVPIIKQHDEKDCAAASLAMVLGYYGKRVPLATAREAIKVDIYGASIYGLQKGAELFGLDASAYEGNAEDVLEFFRNPSYLPCVVRIVKYGFEHFVVVDGFDRNNVYICDPGEGRKVCAFETFSEEFLGQIIVFKKSEHFVKEDLKKGAIKRYTHLIFKQKSLLSMIWVLSLVITTIGMAGAFIFQYLIDNVLHNISESTLENFAVILTGLGVLYFCKFFTELIRGKLLCKLSKRISESLVMGYSDYLTNLPMHFYDTHKTGEVLSRYEDSKKVTDALSSVTLTLFIDLLMTIGCGIILYWKSSVMFSVAVVIFFTHLFISFLFVKPLEKSNRTLMENRSQLTSYLKETVEGAETIKGCQGENYIKSKTRILFSKFVNENTRVSMMSLSKASVTDMLTSIGMLVILWCGAWRVIQGQMTVGEFLTFYTLLNYFLSPVESILNLQSQIQSAFVAADRLNDVLDSKPENGGSMQINSIIDEIAFDDVTFRYSNREIVLNKVSFSAKKGEKLALVGESGSGKSTIGKLIIGLYHAESGDVRINNQPIEAYTLESLREKTAYVSQNIYLFSDTIKNNLIFGLSEEKLPSNEEIKKVLEICCCDFVQEMPFGISSMLEENGSNLSGGQRQRLAIARALLREPQILILDEATSALDSVTEAAIQKNLKEYLPNIIIISVAHRLSTIKDANQILVLDHGIVIESGSHKELYSKSSPYAKMWNKQNSLVS